MEALVGKSIIIRDYTAEAESYYKSKLTFDNPEYYKKLESGRWVGDTPKSISLIQRYGKDLVVPFGMLPDVFKRKKAFDGGIYHSFRFVAEHKTIDYGSSIKPYDYQELAISEAINAKQGVIVAPCGAGKTQIGLEIAARLGGKTLWLTHTSDLLAQSMERAKGVFELKGADYGTITSGKIDIGNVMTFATVQTMNRIDLSDIANKWDVIIVDECHHIAGSPTQLMMFYKVISSLEARYKFGLTATPKRADGLTPCMFALLGPKICEIPRSAVENTTCPVVVKVRSTSYKPDLDAILMPDGTINYSRVVTNVISSAERNDKIVDDIIKADGTCLVLSDRIQHIETLQKKLERAGVKAICLSAATTKKAKEERKTALFALNNYVIKVVLATYALAKEGLDVPSLKNLFLATPQKTDSIVTQSVGRVARKAEGKDCGTVYDYEDGFNMLKSWQRRRNNIYKKLGFEILEEQ